MLDICRYCNVQNGLLDIFEETAIAKVLISTIVVTNIKLRIDNNYLVRALLNSDILKLNKLSAVVVPNEILPASELEPK